MDTSSHVHNKYDVITGGPGYWDLLTGTWRYWDDSFSKTNHALLRTLNSHVLMPLMVLAYLRDSVIY